MFVLASVASVIVTYTVITLVSKALDKKPATEEILFINVAKEI